MNSFSLFLLELTLEDLLKNCLLSLQNEDQKAFVVHSTTLISCIHRVAQVCEAQGVQLDEEWVRVKLAEYCASLKGRKLLTCKYLVTTSVKLNEHNFNF